MWRSCLTEIDRVEDNPIKQKYQLNEKWMFAWVECLSELKKQIKNGIPTERITCRAVRKSDISVSTNTAAIGKRAIKLEAPEPIVMEQTTRSQRTAIVTKRTTRRAERMLPVAANTKIGANDRMTRRATRKSKGPRPAIVLPAIKIEEPDLIVPKMTTRRNSRMRMPEMNKFNQRNPKSVVKIRLQQIRNDSATASIRVNGKSECSARMGMKIIQSPKRKIKIQLVPDAPEHKGPVVTIQIAREFVN